LTAIASRADAVLVIGSANSSNTLALEKVARNVGCPVVQRINGVDELDEAALAGARIVGVTAGASAPEDVVQAVLARLGPGHGGGRRPGRRRAVLPRPAPAPAPGGRGRGPVGPRPGGGGGGGLHVGQPLLLRGGALPALPPVLAAALLHVPAGADPRAGGVPWRLPPPLSGGHPPTPGAPARLGQPLRPRRGLRRRLHQHLPRGAGAPSRVGVERLRPQEPLHRDLGE